MEQAISSDLIRGHIDTIILHTLINGDKHAQQISDFVEEKSGNEYKINQATLYSSLKRLESLKFVQSYWNDSDNGRRKFFKLTENGKNTVDANLSNWSYSRAIIDKLMDCEPQPIYKTQYVEKIVEKIIEVPKESPVIVHPNLNNSLSTEKQETSNVEKLSTIQDNSTDSVQEINFRNILNGLIKSTTPQAKQTVENLEPIQRETIEKKTIEVQKFNETITATDYNAQRNNNGKIDFGDITLKAAKEGYKIRISSKDSYLASGNLLINKLNLFTAFFTYLISIITLMFITLSVGKSSSWSIPVLVVGLVLFSINPIVAAIIDVKAPKKTTPIKITADRILTACIVVFNVILITVAANLLFNVKFSDLNTIALSLILPLSISALVIVYFGIELFLSKLKFFKLNKK